MVKKEMFSVYGTLGDAVDSAMNCCNMETVLLMFLIKSSILITMKKILSGNYEDILLMITRVITLSRIFVKHLNHLSYHAPMPRIGELVLVLVQGILLENIAHVH